MDSVLFAQIGKLINVNKGNTWWLVVEKTIYRIEYLEIWWQSLNSCYVTAKVSILIYIIYLNLIWSAQSKEDHLSPRTDPRVSLNLCYILYNNIASRYKIITKL